MEGEEQLLMSDSSIKLSHREENVHVHRRMVHRSRKVTNSQQPSQFPHTISAPE
jgi:hypothetical protein